MVKLFEARPAGAVALVETPVSRSYVRKARVAFFVVWASAGVVASAVLSTVVDLIPAVSAGVVAGGVCGLLVATVVRVWPVLRVLWHWAAEVVAGVVLVGLSTLLALLTHPLVPLVLVLAAAGVFWFVRPIRRVAASVVWCLVDRHRLRLYFAGVVRSANRLSPGSLPLILFARPTPAGERVWVWLRPGLDLSDLEGKSGKLAVACWADAVRVVRSSERHAALLRVDITRRDPLTALIPSPLARLLPDGESPDRDWSGVPSTLGLDLADVPAVFPEPRSSGRR